MADYNLGDKKGCLIGNWHEEHALLDYAGHFRVPPKDDERSKIFNVSFRIFGKW